MRLYTVLRSIVTDRIVTILVSMCLTLAGSGHAADITLPRTGYKHSQRLGGILIEGPIVKGDFERFEQLALLNHSARGTVWLASPGGDLREAMRIGNLVRQLKWDTWAPEDNSLWGQMIHISDAKNNVCASACFFVYAAGVNRHGNLLGVHRLRLSETMLTDLTLDDAAASNLSANVNASRYLLNMGIPASIIEKASTTDAMDVYWLKPGEVAALSGFIPEIRDWLEAKCSESWRFLPENDEPCNNCTADETLSRWTKRWREQEWKCQHDLIEDAQAKALEALFQQYVDSGRMREIMQRAKVQ